MAACEVDCFCWDFFLANWKVWAFEKNWLMTVLTVAFHIHKGFAAPQKSTYFVHPQPHPGSIQKVSRQSHIPHNKTIFSRWRTNTTHLTGALILRYLKAVAKANFLLFRNTLWHNYKKSPKKMRIPWFGLSAAQEKINFWIYQKFWMKPKRWEIRRIQYQLDLWWKLLDYFELIQSCCWRRRINFLAIAFNTIF